MLKRIYIDNFRSFVNFEIVVTPINLLLGPNGAGKSTVFDVLRIIQAFVRGDAKPGALFQEKDLTRWQGTRIQRFEIELVEKQNTYKYELAIEQEKGRQSPLILHERLWLADRPLINFSISDSKGLVYDDNGAEESIPFIGLQSMIPLLAAVNEHISRFKKRLDRFIVLQMNPGLMSAESDSESSQLAYNAENYVSWYRHIYQNQGKAFEITKVLQEVLEGFEYFKFTEAGEQHRILKLAFSGAKKHQIDYRFDELSDGQRALVVLYTLLYFTQAEDYTLCIDEPENFLALPEIQPWLLTLYDLCQDGKLQALLISHHPELIDFLAASSGYWFDSESNAPIRVRRIGSHDQIGLAFSELTARGWLHEQAG